MHIMAYNGSQVNIDDICRNWQPLSSACFASWVARQAMAENGRKWQKMGCRGYLVGNGFPRVSRHGSRGGQVDNGRKWLKMAENGRKWIFAGKWQEMDFRVFYVTVVEVTRKAMVKMAENGRKWSKKSSPRLFGRKWISACFTSFSYYFQSLLISSYSKK